MLYKVTLKQKTETIGSITANALLGAFLTAYAERYPITEERVRDITFSDLFVAGVLPIGVVNNSTIYNTALKRTQCASGRIYRTLIEREGANLTQPTSYTTRRARTCEFYISTTLLPKTALERIIPEMLRYGLGKCRTVGKGQFELQSIEEFTPPTPHAGVVALSNFIPEKGIVDDEIKETGYFIRHAIATNGQQQAQVMMLLAGTRFKNNRQFAGQHIFDEPSQTWIHGQTICLGV